MKNDTDACPQPSQIDYARYIITRNFCNTENQREIYAFALFSLEKDFPCNASKNSSKNENPPPKKILTKINLLSYSTYWVYSYQWFYKDAQIFKESIRSGMLKVSISNYWVFRTLLVILKKKDTVPHLKGTAFEVTAPKYFNK